MIIHARRRSYLTAILGIALATIANAQASSVTGSFVMNGKDGRLTHVRAMKTLLGDGAKKAPGYVVLLSERPAEGDFASWRSADPKERGNFIYAILEANGTTWVAELGHTERTGSSGTIGVVQEFKKVSLTVKDGRISGQYRTGGEETFSDNRFTIDVTFDAPLEGK